MQTIAHIIDNRTNEKILVLLRLGRKIDKYTNAIYLKKRKSGTDGRLLIAETEYLNDQPQLIDRLLNNEVLEIT